MNKEPAKFQNSKGEIHIWYISLDQWRKKTGELKSLLSPEEITRGERFVIPDRANDFYIQKGLIRLLLSQYLNQNPENILFSSSETGKPFISNTELHYNVSHSNDLLLCGLSADAPLGVDIQHIYAISPLDRIIKKILSPSEIKLISTISSDEYLDHFFTIWAAKEAFLKASGEGFSRSPNQFTVYHLEDNEIFLKYDGDQVKTADDIWTIRDLKIDPDYKAVLVYAEEIIDIKVEQFIPPQSI